MGNAAAFREAFGNLSTLRSFCKQGKLNVLWLDGFARYDLERSDIPILIPSFSR